MTPDERKKAALNEIATTLKMLGCELSVQYQTEQLGAVLQTRAQIVVKTLADWQPPNDVPVETLSTNVDGDSPE